jgi:hypothetical protein
MDTASMKENRMRHLCLGVGTLSLILAASSLGAGCQDAAPPVPRDPGLKKPESPSIPMKETAALSAVWAKAAAGMPEDHKAWKGINNVLDIKAGTLHPSKEERLAGAYSLSRSGKDEGTQGLAARALLDAGIPEVTRELLLHPIPDLVAATARHLAKPAAGEERKAPGTAPEPAMRDTQAVPFLIYVLNRNNYHLDGSEEATIHLIVKQRIVDAILYNTDIGAKVGAVNVDRCEDVDLFLAVARKWAAEKGLQPLEKQRPPKAEPPSTEPQPAPGGTLPRNAKHQP